MSKVLYSIAMRYSSLLLLSIVTTASLSFGAQDRLSNYGAAPNVHLMTIPRKVDVSRYPEDQRTTTVEFRGTALAPKAEGQARIETSSTDIKIEAHIRSLSPAENIDPEQLTYVLWAVTTDGSASNLGELVFKRKDATLTASTTLRSFALMVTAEPYFAVKVPSEFVVLYNVLSNNQNQEIIRADLLQIHPDSKAPLDIFEARNAIRIARLAGAERYAAEIFHKALQLLQQAETIFADRANPESVAVEEKAREATEAAEDARSKAVQSQRESTISH